MTASKHLILLTNDDGYLAPGITALRLGLEHLGRVVEVAPDREMSATSLALTLNHPLRVKEVRQDVYAVDGTPADCVYLAVRKLLDRAPSLIVSGVNNGPNLGQQDAAYSGTVAGAVQGTFFGIPSMAVSCLSDADRNFDFAYAARVAGRLAEALLGRPLPNGITLNVNIPPAPFKGVRITKLGRKKFSPEILEARDPRRQPYFWIGLGKSAFTEEAQSDIEATRQGFVSLTPLHSDLTSYEVMRDPALTGLAADIKEE